MSMNVLKEVISVLSCVLILSAHTCVAAAMATNLVLMDTLAMVRSYVTIMIVLAVMC